MKLTITALCLLGFCFAETSTPVGFNKVVCLSGSDTHVSVPFHQKPVFFGSLTQNSNGSNTLNFDSNLSANVTSTPHYVKITSGTSTEGKWFDVTGSSANSITIDLNGDTTNITSGSTFKVIPHWTLSTLFPVGNSTIHQSSGDFIFQRGSSILFPDYAGEAINKPAEAVYYIKSSGWHQDTAGTPAADDVILYPNSSLIIRHREGHAQTTYIPKGVVETAKSEILLQSSSTTQVDNPVSIDRPIPISLKDLDLASNFEESSGNFIFQRKDELHVFDNSESKINKAASKIFFKKSGTWYQDTSGLPVADDEIINPSEYLVIRKAIGSGNTSQWVNEPSY